MSTTVYYEFIKQENKVKVMKVQLLNVKKKTLITDPFLYVSSAFVHSACPKATHSDQHCRGSWPTPNTMTDSVLFYFIIIKASQKKFS